MSQDTTIFEKKLREEKIRLDSELATIAHREKGTKRWEAIGTMTDGSIDADSNEVADKLEEFETNQAIAGSLNAELGDVEAALDRIEQGIYGVCEICGKPIEEDRLMANPAARTCKAHINN